MSKPKQLFVFLEGPDDERFFKNVCESSMHNSYEEIRLIQYAGMTPKACINFFKTIKSQLKADYIFLTDLDSQGDKKFDVVSRITKVIEKFNREIDESNIIVVKEEIESWYLAGLTPSNLKKFNIKTTNNTELLNKEYFIQQKPKQFTSKTDFMIEILKEYSLEIGITRNNSLRFFTEKHRLI